MNVVKIYEGEDACERCEGWKRIDDGDDGTSWKNWMELPAASRIAIQLGIVKPIECPRCHGTGIEPKEEV